MSFKIFCCCCCYFLCLVTKEENSILEQLEFWLIYKKNEKKTRCPSTNMMMMMMGRLPRFFWRSFTHLNENIHILDIFNDVYYYIPLKFNHFFMQKRQPRPIIIIIITKWLLIWFLYVLCVFVIIIIIITWCWCFEKEFSRKKNVKKIRKSNFWWCLNPFKFFFYFCIT